ncbi:hypothetical protein ACFL0W_05670 [Nanoarchaeota archaeon]
MGNIHLRDVATDYVLRSAGNYWGSEREEKYKFREERIDKNTPLAIMLRNNLYSAGWLYTGREKYGPDDVLAVKDVFTKTQEKTSLDSYLGALFSQELYKAGFVWVDPFPI